MIVYYRGQKYSRRQFGDRLCCWLMSACCRSCQQTHRCWIFISLLNVTQRLADYQPVTKRASTFLLMLFIISIDSYLFASTINRMHNNSVSRYRENTFLLPCANFIQKKNSLKTPVFSTIALIYGRRSQKWLLIECTNIYYGKVLK